jgi:hemerythrin-like domain-containing protein
MSIKAARPGRLPFPRSYAMSEFFRTPAPGFDDPLGLLRACHGRIRERLDTLERLPEHLLTRGADAEVGAAARRILEYFDRAAPHHHADEDRDLFPLLLNVAERPGWDPGLPETLERLAAEHALLEDGWAQLRSELEALALGENRTLPEADDWIRATRAHLSLEESRVLPLAGRLLTNRDLRRLGRAMALRRGAEFPDG